VSEARSIDPCQGNRRDTGRSSTGNGFQSAILQTVPHDIDKRPHDEGYRHDDRHRASCRLRAASAFRAPRSKSGRRTFSLKRKSGPTQRRLQLYIPPNSYRSAELIKLPNANDVL
jgi:hypothetical protein